MHAHTVPNEMVSITTAPGGNAMRAENDKVGACREGAQHTLRERPPEQLRSVFVGDLARLHQTGRERHAQDFVSFPHSALGKETASSLPLAQAQ